MANLYLDNMMKKIGYCFIYLFLMTFVCCKLDVGLGTDNNTSQSIDESKRKGLFKNSYSFKTENHIGEPEIVEAWSEYVFYYENGNIIKDNKHLNFNVRFRFNNPRNNFFNTKVYYINRDTYFYYGAHVSDVFTNKLRDSFKEADTLKLLMKVGKDTIPVLFFK